MENKIESLQYYNPGDLVVLKHKKLKGPIMLIQEKVTKQYKSDDTIKNIFKGFRCVWFSTDMKLQEAVFSTKDLELYK